MIQISRLHLKISFLIRPTAHNPNIFHLQSRKSKRKSKSSQWASCNYGIFEEWLRELPINWQFISQNQSIQLMSSHSSVDMKTKILMARELHNTESHNNHIYGWNAINVREKGDYNLLWWCVCGTMDVTLSEPGDGLLYWTVTIGIGAAVYEKWNVCRGCARSSAFGAVRCCWLEHVVAEQGRSAPAGSTAFLR